jgi:thioester reductase-like protein
VYGLVSGFPGFIARRLVARLLADRPQLRLTALVEARMLDAARSAAEALGADGARLELVVGDIADRRLGLDDAQYAALAGKVTEVHHLAAIYNLAVPLEVAQRVNVDGTGNVLDFCLACKDLRQLHYVSTAYVAGLRTGVVYEHELSLGQQHKNHYESTKFQAEVWVREQMHRIPTTIYRPAIVVGDSRTGETQKFDGPYYLLRAIARSVRRKEPILQLGRAAAPFNVVPVDFVVEAMATVAQDPEAVGETLHLVDPEPLTAKELNDLFAREYAGRTPRIRVPAGIVHESLRLKPIREMYDGTPRESIVYLNHPVRFDTRRADAILARNGLRCPKFPEYVGPIVQFFREHEGDAALKPV